MAKVVPALLSSTKSDYEHDLAVVRQLTDRFQLDIIDGQFVDNETVSLNQLDKTPGLKMDIHLMVVDPISCIREALKLSPNLVLFQYEGSSAVPQAITELKQNGQRVGLAINPSTTIEKIKSLLSEIDHLLVMMYPAGFAGQKFEPVNLDKISQARDIRPDLEIGIDGGVNKDSIKQIANAKPDIVNVNSYLFSAEDVASRYSELMEAFK